MSNTIGIGWPERLAAAGIRIDGYTYIDSGRDFWMVSHDWQELDRFFNKAEAEQFARDIWLAMGESDAIGALDAA